MPKKSLLAAALFAAALGGSGATAVFAGEITGTGKTTPPGSYAVPASICSFSGLNDTPNDPGIEGGRTQNYGQIVRLTGLTPEQLLATMHLPSPGMACRGNGG